MIRSFFFSLHSPKGEGIATINIIFVVVDTVMVNNFLEFKTSFWYF